MTDSSILTAIQHRFKFKKFQRQDLARAAMHDGLIMSWDTGCGKTVAAYAWPLLKVGWHIRHEDGVSVTVPNEPVLLVIPGDLHQQTITEGWEKFRVRVKPLESQADFLKLTAHASLGSQSIPPDFYITSYTDLTTNGVARIPDPMDAEDVWKLMDQCLKAGEHQPLVDCDAEWLKRPDFETACEFYAWRGKCWANEFDRLNIDPKDTRDDLETARTRQLDAASAIDDEKLRAKEITAIEEAYHILRYLLCNRPDPQFKWLVPDQQTFIIRHWLNDKFSHYDASIGLTKQFVKLVETPVAASDDSAAQTEPDPDAPRLAPGWAKYNPEAKQTFTQKLKLDCVYSPSLADLSYQSFACVVVDEGVKMKGEDTYVGKGVRKMDPKYRLVLTATPVKNRLPDIFRLAHWATGGHANTTARWPYREDSGARTKFAETFMVSERNLSKERAANEKNNGRGSYRRFQKLTAEVCNIHRLWKLLGPIVLRRRKDDTGEDIVPKIRKVIRCEMGTLQQEVYQYHLQANYIDKNNEPAIGAKLQALRMAAADPSSSGLESQGEVTKPCRCRYKAVEPKVQRQRLIEEQAKLEADNSARDQYALEKRDKRLAAIANELQNPVTRYDMIEPNPTCATCKGEGYVSLRPRSGQGYIPKMASCLTLIEEILARKEQVVVFSAFCDPLDNLSRYLDEAAVPHVNLDGRVSQKKRGKLAAQFKLGPPSNNPTIQQSNNPSDPRIPVMLAGVESMAEGHSFHLANNVILIAYSWAYDKFIQAINRVHRMTSQKPVNVYVIVCHGTIDLRLESLIQDKGDAAELVLDGRLMGERAEEVNLADLLKIAHEEFAAIQGEGGSIQTIDEALIHAQWPALRDKLKAAMAAWSPEPGRADLPVRQLTQTPIVAQIEINGKRITEPSTKGNKVRRTTAIKVKTPEAPTHTLQTPALDQVGRVSPLTAEPSPQPATCNIQPATNNDWRAKLRAKIAGMTARPVADVWKQL